jgi:hypothetical protein
MIVPVTRSRTVITALCVVSVLALGACSGSDPQPKFADPTPTVPSSPSTTAVSGPIEPTMPAAAQGTDAAAAEAFVKFYWEMVNYAQATGDLDGLRSISPADCEACQRGVDYLDSVFRRDGRVRGGENSLSSISSGPVGGDGKRRYVRFDLSNTRQVVAIPGHRDEVYRAATVHGEAVLVKTPTGWRLEYWGKQS